MSLGNSVLDVHYSNKKGTKQYLTYNKQNRCLVT